MTTLLLMRHAKSSWKSQATNDHQRPLNARGRRDAPIIAHHLQKYNLLPELVLSSDSRRTTLTWQKMQECFEAQIPVHYSPDLYHGSLNNITDQIVALAEPPDRIMVLGHNPGWEYTASVLCNKVLEMTTANVVILEHESRWKEAIQDIGGWTFKTQIRPKDLL